MSDNYLNPGPTREEIDQTTGGLVLEFGTDWCPHCIAGQAIADEALLEFPAVQHIQVEDGQGRRLGRSYKVKLWPTFIFLKDGVEVARAVRPSVPDELRQGLTALQTLQT